MYKSIPQIRNVDEVMNCEICNSNIDFAGSKYVSASGEVTCLKCIEYLQGDRDDQSYVSSLEKTRNSKGGIIFVL